MLFAFVISLAALLARFPSAFGYTLADGGFSDSLHLIDFTNVDHHPLDIRQLGQGPIPSQCSSICDPVSASLNANCTAVQCCTSSFEEEVFQCFTCLEDALHETNFTQSQTAIDGLYNACTTLGFSLPILTFPGQSVNRPLSSLPSSATSTDTQSQSTTSVSQTTGTGTTLINPWATISQTAITSLSSHSATTQPPTPTSSSTSTSTTRATSSGKKIEVGIPVWVWMQAMGGVLIFFLII